MAECSPDQICCPPFDPEGWQGKEMNRFLSSREIKPRKMYTYYTTCPKCAKKYGKNYVVMLAQVD